MSSPHQTAHAILVDRAASWLRHKAGCSVVLSELVTTSAWGEIPDAIGWRGGISILVECKVSRADFLADAKKRFRIQPDYGVGRHRYYLCKPGIISAEELRPGWGLLHLIGRKVVTVAGNSENASWGTCPFVTNYRAEIKLLTSALRRIPNHDVSRERRRAGKEKVPPAEETSDLEQPSPEINPALQLAGLLDTQP